MSGRRIEQPIHLQSGHIKLLKSGGMVTPNQDGRDMVNFDDQTKPSINSIYSFTIPVDVLPNNAISFGDCLKFVSSQSSTRAAGMFTCDDEAQNNMKSATARLLALLTATLCDDTIGSKPHMDYYTEVVQSINATTTANSPTTNITVSENKNGPDTNTDGNSTSSTDSNSTTEKNVDSSKSSDSSSTSSSDSSSSSSESESDDEKDDSSDSSAENNEEKAKKSSKNKDSTSIVTTTNKETANKDTNNGPKTVAISRKRNKTSQDIEYDRMLQERSVMATKMDIRGQLHQPQYLYFTYNGKKYPKFRVFVEELEGHSSMPEKHIPVTNRVELPRTHDRVTELLQTTLERNASEPRIGNGFLVGIRIWIFVLDPGIRLYDRIKYFIKEQNKRNMSANVQQHPNPLYVAPLNDICNESFYNTHVLFPYVTYGSYFRHIASDPVVKSVTRSRNGQDAMNKVKTHSGSSEFNRALDKVAQTEMKKKQENHYKTQDQKDYTHVGRNISPSSISKEGFSPEIFGRYIPGLSNSGFITNMANVCDTQREPGNYFNVQGRASLLKPVDKKGKNHKTKKNVVQQNTEVAQDVDGMELDTPDDDDTKRSSADSIPDDIVDPAMVNYDLTKTLTVTDQVRDLDFSSENDDSQSQKLLETAVDKDDGKSDDDIDDDTFKTQDEIRYARPTTENSYVLSNKKYVYGCKDATEHETKGRKIFEDLTEIIPSAFKGFPCSHLVTEYRASYFGSYFMNAPFPHIMRAVEDEPLQKILALSSQKKYKQQILKNARFSQRISAVASQSGQDLQAIDMVNVGDTTARSSSHSHGSSDSQIVGSRIYEDKLLSYCLNIHKDRVRTKRVIVLNDADLDYKSRTTEQMKRSLLKAEAQINENESGNIPHETILLYTYDSSLNLQTSRELDLLTKGTRETALVEIARNQLTASELEIFASKNDLIMLRLRFCVEATNIGAKYPKSDRFYRKAMRELRRRQTNDFVHTLQHSQKLPKSLLMAIQWYMTMAAKKRQFTSIPMVYKQFGIFGNYFQFIRGVLSEVMLARNNVELFYMMHFVYLTSLCYTYYLRPHFLASGPPTASKSFNKNCVGQMAVPGTFQNISHTTAMHLLQEEDYYYLTHAFDEAPDLFAANKGKGGPNSESAGGGSRIMKEWTASSKVTTRSFYWDRETKGKPRRKVDEMLTALQITLICLCNQETLPPDAPLMQRFLFYVQPRKTNEKAFKIDKPEPSKTETSLLDATGEIPANVKVYSKPADLKRICFANQDYQNSLDGDHIETCQLIACYTLFFECMVTAVVVEDISVDLAERWLPEIFDRFTASVGDKDVNPRNMMQSALVSRSMAASDMIVTVLFTDILYPDLKQEKTVVVSQDSNLTPVEDFEKATSLNISKFRRYCRRHAYVSLEHVVTTATMFEHFICNPYNIPIFNTALELAHWPHSITLNNFRGGSKNDESTYLSRAFKNTDVYGITTMHLDARYACLTESSSSLILRSIHSKHSASSEEIAFNDVQRTIGSQARIFVNAHACMIMTLHWKDYLKGEMARETPKTDSKKQSKPKRHRSKAEKTNNNSAGQNVDDTDEETNNKGPNEDKSMEEEEEEETEKRQKNVNTTTHLDPSSSNRATASYNVSSVTDRGRIYLEVESDPSKKIPIPDTVTELQKWYAMAFDSYDEFLEMLSKPEKREMYGILEYKVLKNANEVWLKISEKIIPCERVPVVRFETDSQTSKKRISFLIEYTENGQQKTMKNAIEMTLASNSIPKSGVFYQSIKPYQGLNVYSKRYEYSSYLTDVIQIPYIADNYLYCLNPIPSKEGGRRHLDCKSISLGGLHGEHSPYTRAEKHFAKISKKISNLSSIDDIQSASSEHNYGENDDDDDLEGEECSDSDSDDDEDTPYREYKQHLHKTKKINPYLLDSQIRDLIRNATGITFNGVNLNEYAQLRHWFRCGINPLTPVLIKLPSDEEGKIKTIQMPKYVTYSVQYINNLLYTINSKLEESPDHKQTICSDYISLWLEECNSNNERENRRESTCTHVHKIFSEIYKTKTPAEKTKDVVVTGSNGQNLQLSIISMHNSSSIDSYTTRVFGDSDTLHTSLIGANTLNRIEKQMNKNKTKNQLRTFQTPVPSIPVPKSGQEDSNTKSADPLCVGKFKTPEKNRIPSTNVGAPTPIVATPNFASPDANPKPVLPKIAFVPGGIPLSPFGVPKTLIPPTLLTKRSLMALASDDDSPEQPPAKYARTDNSTVLFDTVSSGVHNSAFT